MATTTAAAAEAFGVEVYRCGQDYDPNDGTAAYEALIVPAPITNGERFQICLEPNDAARTEGIYIAVIKTFDFVERENTTGQRIRQTVVAMNDPPAENTERTEVTCHRGSALCVIDTILSNAFFYKSGQIEGVGTLYLQFGYRPARGLVAGRGQQQHQQQQHQPPLITGDTEDAAASSSSFSVAEAHQQLRRALQYQVGEVIGGPPIAVTVDLRIAPSSKRNYDAEMYQCDSQNFRLPRPKSVPRGRPIRLCVTPNAAALAAGVYITALDQFSYGSVYDINVDQYGILDTTIEGASYQQQHADTLSVAIDANGHPSDMGNTQVRGCNQEDGRPTQLCTIETILEDGYFFMNTRMIMTGFVSLQFGPEPFTASASSSAFQEELGFAGRSQVSYYHDTVSSSSTTNGGSGSSTGGSSSSASGSDYVDTVTSWWTNMLENHLTGVILTLVVIVGGVFLCCMLGCFFFCRYRRTESSSRQAPLTPEQQLQKQSQKAKRMRNNSYRVSASDGKNNSTTMGSSSLLQLYPTERMHTSMRSSNNEASSSMLDMMEDSKTLTTRDYDYFDEIAQQTYKNSRSLITTGNENENDDDSTDDEHITRTTKKKQQQQQRARTATTDSTTSTNRRTSKTKSNSKNNAKKSKKKKRKKKALDETTSNDVSADSTMEKEKVEKGVRTTDGTTPIAVIVPNEDDVCFEVDEHPGTIAFLQAVQNTVQEFTTPAGPAAEDSSAAATAAAYSPKIYKHIKRQLPGIQFYVAADPTTDHADSTVVSSSSSWRKVSKRELIDLFCSYYEQATVE